MMNRRTFIRHSLAGMGGVLLSGHSSFLPAAGNKPNIILIVTDDLGWKDVSYHGSEIRTPNIDRLAKEGLELDRFYVAPICSPTRAGLLTGRYPIRFGLMRSVIPPWRAMGMPPEEELVPEMLARAGYRRRACIGKWHLGHCHRKYHPIRQGFTHFYGHYNGRIDYFTHLREGELDWHRNFDPCYDQGYTTDLLTAESIRFIEDSRGGEPFFLYLAYNAPHTRLQAKKEHLKKYSHLKGKRQTFAAMVASVDENIGRIVQALKRKGIEDDTLIIFMSDNGGNRGEGADNGPLRGQKQDVFEGGIRVPAFISWPAGFKGGRKIDGPMAYIDIFPTLRRIVGAPAGRGRPLDGLDMSAVLKGQETAPDRDLYCYWGQDGEVEKLTIFNTEWKLVFDGEDVFKADLKDKEHLFLFRLTDDPYEKRNVLSSHRSLAGELLERLRAFRALRPAGGVPPYAEGREGFKAPPEWNMDRYPAGK